MDTELKGKLEFISLFQPVKLFADDGEIDLREHYFKLFERLNGIKSKMSYGMNNIEICSDEDSDSVIQYENDDNGILILLNKVDKFGMSNVGAYLPGILQSLNGRHVIVSIKENGISIANDPEENVLELYYTNSNCCKIPEGEEQKTCKIGTIDCCIFCCAGADGFECLKFNSPSARMLLDRYSKKEMRASRIGNCAIVGRNENL